SASAATAAPTAQCSHSPAPVPPSTATGRVTSAVSSLRYRVNAGSDRLHSVPGGAAKAVSVGEPFASGWSGATNLGILGDSAKSTIPVNHPRTDEPLHCAINYSPSVGQTRGGYGAGHPSAPPFSWLSGGTRQAYSRNTAATASSTPDSAVPPATRASVRACGLCSQSSSAS